MPPAPIDADAAKNVHARIPSSSRNTKPPDRTAMMYLKAIKYTVIITSGFTSDQRKPNNEPRYLSLRSLNTRLRISSRYCTIAASDARRPPPVPVASTIPASTSWPGLPLMADDGHGAPDLVDAEAHAPQAQSEPVALREQFGQPCGVELSDAHEDLGHLVPACDGRKLLPAAEDRYAFDGQTMLSDVIVQKADGHDAQ